MAAPFSRVTSPQLTIAHLEAPAPHQKGTDCSQTPLISVNGTSQTDDTARTGIRMARRTRMPRRVWVIERYQLHPVVVPQSMHTLHVPFCTMRELPQVGQVLPSYRRSP